MTPVQSWPPTAGTYAVSLVRGGPQVPLRIWYGLPVIDGEEQDRAPRWNVEVDGHTTRLVDGVTELLDVDRHWPWCARKPISDEVYRFMLAHAEWARAGAPGTHPKASPYTPIDFNALPVRF